MYDLLLKGGTVVDASQGLHGASDIAVQDGKIAAIAPDVPSEEATRVINVAGKIVTPGLIDLHVHVFDGFSINGVNPDLVGVRAGVTTLVDAGSAGCATIGGFPRHIIPNCHTEIIPFMDLCQTGNITRPYILTKESIDLEGMHQAVEQHQGLIGGIKVRMVSPALETLGMEMPRLGKQAARDNGIKLMVHIGDLENRYDPNVIRELLPILDEGDIVTHFFTPYPGGILDDNGKLVPEAKEAADRGVWLDTGHGMFCFGFDVARRILDQGLLPHCISTDISIRGRLHPVHGMTEIMTRFLGLGFTLDQVVTMCTTNPAKALGQDTRLGSLAVGRQADVSVLQINEGDWTVYDSLGASLRVRKAVLPVLTVKRGRVFEPDWGPLPWGWEPHPA